LLAFGALVGCSGAQPRPAPPSGAPAAVSSVRPAQTAPARDVEFADKALAAWLESRLPKGGVQTNRPDGSVEIVHTVQGSETVADVAEAYLELTNVYLADDLAQAIRDENRLGSTDTLAPGVNLQIPSIVGAVPKPPSESRLGWPEDKNLRGLHLRGQVAAGKSFPRVLDAMSVRGINLVVLDVKDADGRLTYPSRVALANEVGAVRRPSIRHLARTIQFAHDRGIRVAMRIVCFEDALLSRARSDLAVQSVRGRPLYIGWVDPGSETVQNYLLELAAEAMDAGADEVQLDYVRYPVIGAENADFRLKQRGRSKPQIIRDFVHRVHELTQSRGVPLSLDVFGILAEGVRSDVQGLGQDPVLLARECEAIAPMLYPSHYPKGFMGFEEPGDHPELVRVGVRKLIALIRRGRPRPTAVVRPWIQGMSFHSPSFGPQYIAEEVNHAKQAGAAGWMLWNPTQDYSDTWQGITPQRPAPASVASR
jgi:hypothetical protein